ncbi:MAG: helicase [Marmoricola sp.]|nr:helicase [Marmoricola sp.]
MSSTNKVVIASAGSGKTELIVDSALAVPRSERVLITTYTTDGQDEIRQRFVKKQGHVPANVTILGWFAFLLRHGIRPYQHPVLGVNEIAGVIFERRPFRVAKAKVRPYYLTNNGSVYSEHAADLALVLNERAGGAAVDRISTVFPHIYVDEVQDISGRDFEFIEAILGSPTRVTLVGDPRQGTFATTQTRTNRGKSQSRIPVWFKQLEQKGLATIEELTHSHRCHQEICDFADQLYEDMSYPATKSLQLALTGHDGVFIVPPDRASEYAATYRPQVLRLDVKTKTGALEARNFGEVKGRTFQRVMIFPSAGIEQHVLTKASLATITRAKFYVGITRARHSVGLVLDDKSGSSGLPIWEGVADSAISFTETGTGND